MHGFSIIIHCTSIGSNCTIFQQVIIGATDKGTSAIGDIVRIYCGAKVLGNIRVGNNGTIGANAVVVKDVPDKVVVVGVPAHIIKYKNDEYTI